ncbi:YbaB/EbfC family nucleoid-associated protein [Natronosporangium hydrolyticum]|uniref:YbaB/EbfC family nucleoid-associated protein n=1 Tax=Natronosporangium hydrolyticum TaxID=2811111 RepID=A0A895YCT5_9ACTN|nr:YbaB/EbfC family nucleoid-associated protein [Natronosporangium hydrolyticum]QSB15321.1 YbaB/EbfC family nucleoid-associated protein [Natronosporangium hydrolyticum]
MATPTDPTETLSVSAMEGIMAELNESLRRIPETQERLMSLSGVAWSEDRMVKATVGPRGQLTGLEIDPRVFRRPDAQMLSTTILAAVNTAVARVMAEAQEIMMGEMPPELAELRTQFAAEQPDPVSQILMTDADIVQKRSGADGDLR